MDKQTAMQILQSRVVINQEGKYTVKVTSTNVYTDPDTGVTRTIVNFNAMTPYNASVALKAFQEGDYDAATGKGTSMSASQLKGQFVPSKGETVDVEVVDYITKDGEATFVVSSIIARQAKKAQAFSLEAIAQEEPAEAKPIA